MATSIGAGRDGPFRCKTDIHVRFRDLDATGRVNGAVYATYFEIAREAYWRAATGAPDLRDQNLVIAAIECAYHAPARRDDDLEVWVRVGALGRTSFTYEYRVVRRDDGRLVASGRSTQVMYDFAAGRAVPIPPALRAQFAAYEGRPLDGDPS